MKYVIYTDGSCIPNPDGYGGWAFVVKGENIQYSGGFPNATNNLMELYAIYMAIDWCPAGCVVEIHSDSKIALGWAMGKTIVTPDYAISLCKIINATLIAKSMILYGVLVKGHAGVRENEIANDLAQQAARKGA